MTAPVVSVVIPAYNAETYLAATIESVLAQTFRDLEIIVVDDGSKDRTAAIARSFPQVRYVYKENGGVSTARNRGIAEARGEFVALLDADDLWKPSKLQRQVELMRARREAGVCFAGFSRVDSDLRVLQTIEAREFENLTEALLLHSNVISGSCSSVLIRRALLSDSTFDPRFSQCADWDCWLRMSLTTRFAAVPEPLVLYRVSGASMSSSAQLLERDTFAVLDDFFARSCPPALRPLKAHAYSNHWLILAGSYLHARDLRNSLRSLGNAVRLRPQSVVRVAGLPVRWARRGFAKMKRTAA